MNSNTIHSDNKVPSYLLGRLMHRQRMYWVMSLLREMTWFASVPAITLCSRIASAGFSRSNRSIVANSSTYPDPPFAGKTQPRR